MKRALLLDHLALAERHVREGEEHVASQKAMVEKIEARGQDASTAKRLLRTYTRTQSALVADRDRLRLQLAKLNNRPDLT